MSTDSERKSSDSSQLALAISSLDLFAGLPSIAMEEMIALGRVRSLTRGARLFDQGERIERAHALLSGAVRITQTGSDGAEVVVRFIGPGEIFGSVAIFTDDRYPAEGMSMVESLDVSWGRAELLDLIGRYPQVAINFVGIVGRRLAESQVRVREMATQRVQRRIANALLRLAEQGTISARGSHIPYPLRRRDIADISGTTLHTVSRTLNNWRRQGLIIDDKRGLILTSPKALRRASD